MVDKNKIINLTNRDNGFVGYTIPDTGAHKKFSPGETKQVTFDEIEKLSWVSGGKELLQHFLIIEDKEAAEEILGEVEPEYFYTKETVDKLLKEGSIEQLQDTLNFGPDGVIDLVKEEAVKLKIDSMAKREEIKKATNFNVSNAIELNEGDNNIGTDAATSKRKAAPMAASGTNSPSSSTSTTGKYRNVILK